MPTTDDSFVASGPARTGFNASVEQGKKPFDFGVTGFGRKAGVLGEAGLPGPLPASAFSGFAGVIGYLLTTSACTARRERLAASRILLPAFTVLETSSRASSVSRATAMARRVYRSPARPFARPRFSVPV